jgi:sugar transferase EpsL
MRLTFYVRHGKRGLDIALSLGALAVLAPILAGVATLVRVFLGSPVLFRQRRTGWRKKGFTIVKFRTMTMDLSASGTLLPDSDRLTRLGRFLRATSLDELPEFWNVLKGDMSLVGPRPLIPRYDAYYTERENRRFDLRPGITGLAQISGRNGLPWDDRLMRDVEYVESVSFFLDVRILVVTCLKVIRRDDVHVNTELEEGSLDDARRMSGVNYPRKPSQG